MNTAYANQLKFSYNMNYARFVAFCMTCVFFFSCKKDSIEIEDGLYFHFTVDGNEMRFSNDVNSTFSPGYNGAEFLSGEGVKTNGINTENAITISISSDQAIVAKKEYARKNPKDNIALIYMDNIGQRYDLSFFQDENILTSDAKIKIEKMNDHTLKGTFSGTVYNTLNANDHHFISGTFSLRE